MVTPTLFVLGYGALTMVAFIFMAVALGTNHWLDITPKLGSDSSFGLFKVCSKDCEDFSDSFFSKTKSPLFDISTIDAARGLCVTAILLYAVGALVMAHFAILRKMQVQSKLHGFLTLILCILAAIFGISAVANFVSSYDDVMDLPLYRKAVKDWSYGFSLYLAAFSAIMAFFAGLLALLSVHFAVQRNQSTVHM